MSLGAPVNCATHVAPNARSPQLMWLAVLGAVAALILIAGLSGLGPRNGPARTGGHPGAPGAVPGMASTHLNQAPLGLVFNAHTHRWTCVGTGHRPARLM